MPTPQTQSVVLPSAVPLADTAPAATPRPATPRAAAARAATPAGGRDRPWADAAAAVLALVLPVACVGCGAPDRALCRACRSVLDALPGRTRLVAGVRLDAAHEYDGLVRTLVLEWKLRGRVDVVSGLTRRTADLVRAALAAAPVGALVLRVPPSSRGHRRRGFDPVVTVLRRAGVRRARALRRVPVPQAGPGSDSGPGPDAGRGSAGVRTDGRGQKERTAVERVAATVGSLVADGVADRDVVLVDDVVTTGVTMAEAVRAVRGAGGRVVRCVAVATVEV
ncbi:phosphoribosyltransferase family protein [Curtobacterium sp. MCPF17_001]|uniref:phosphoribosyltransferase family protein n=1 Tax=Curtobacterium sp. MCPF17_001 TaxID=2175651 RepID=UPI0011B76CED|nr:phosphoribosyltransferase family protein [Curtobacterium sp. MCPF17_001]